MIASTLKILYIDDACLISPSSPQINAEVKSLQKDFDLTDDGKLCDYLGTQFNRYKDGFVELTMSSMIQRVLEIVCLNHTDVPIKLHDSPASQVLHDCPTALPREQKWNYQSVVSCLSYIQA